MIDYCLREAGLSADQLNYIAFYDKPMVKFERLLETYLAYAPDGLRSLNMAMPVWLKKKLFMRGTIRRGVGTATKAPLVFLDHHESHAASAFFPSPFEEAAILTLDGVGEVEHRDLWVGSRQQDQAHATPSVSALAGTPGYSAFTFYTGFKVNSGEYN